MAVNFFRSIVIANICGGAVARSRAVFSAAALATRCYLLVRYFFGGYKGILVFPAGSMVVMEFVGSFVCDFFMAGISYRTGSIEN